MQEEEDSLVEHHPESSVPPVLYEAHRKLWDSDIDGAEEVLPLTTRNCHHAVCTAWPVERVVSVYRVVFSSLKFE
jgi:hypothetical protein